MTDSNSPLRRESGRLNLLNLIKAKPDLITRHLSNFKVNESTGCHEWQGALSSGHSKNGHAKNEQYGVVSVSIDGKSTKVQAHRLAYTYRYDVDPNDMVVMHKVCDNPKCINSDHLELGTHADNMNDMADKGRASDQSGANNGNAKITKEVASEVFYLIAIGEESSQIYLDTGVSLDMISLMRRGKRWRALGVELGYLEDKAA